MICLVFERLGLHSRWEDGDILVPGGQKLVVARDAGDYQSKVEDGPWPAFPADLTSIAVALATQSEGSVLIFEKMFENRLFFVDKLISMGAEITICDPHRAIVSGPSRLHGERLSSPDIRAGMAMLIAALAADGRSDHAVRSPPGDRLRSEPSSRRTRRQPGHPRRHGDAHRGPCRRRPFGDQQPPRDRPRLRADRRAAAGPGRAHRARRHLALRRP